MNEWIEFNLPYNVRVALDRPVCPDLDKKEHELFGLPEEIDIDNYDYDKVDKINKIQQELCPEEMGNSEVSLSALEKYAETSEDKEFILAIIKHRRRTTLVNEWWEIQPEYIKWIADCQELRDKEMADAKLLSFVGAGLNVPGTMIEVETEPDKTSQFLIGDINTLRGVCDDCTAFDDNAIVKRYKVIL
jgi:hypothetical protein